ncbi:MAG: hypothetical protein R2724_33110 [Bryobacterales bacterium]
MRAGAETSVSISRRGEYRCGKLDRPTSTSRHPQPAARFALDGGDPAEARKHAEIAKERAYCDGPPHYYKPAYEEAERLIAEASDTSG